MDIARQKQLLYARLMAELRGFGLDVLERHSSPDKPWGAYIRIAEASLPGFYAAYYRGVEGLPAASPEVRLDPKILLVAPGARLSLQYHHRRAEFWRVIGGPVVVVSGKTETECAERVYQVGDVIRLECGELHRLIGLETWGQIAEIWCHTDPANPSDEDDIVRVQDDYGR